MPRLSRSQEVARRRIMELGRRRMLPEALGQAVLAALTPAIPSMRTALFGVDPASLLINRVLATTDSIANTTDWLRRIYIVNEPTLDLSFLGLIRAGVPAYVHRETFETSWGVPRSLFGPMAPERYRREFAELGSPPGGILRGCFAARGVWVAALDAVRFDASAPFSATDVTFLRAVGPLIGEAIAASLVRERAAWKAAALPEAAGVLLLDPEGSVLFHTPEAERWLELLAEQWWEPVCEVRSLPAAVWAATAPLRAPSSADRLAIARAPTAAGQVRIEATAAAGDERVIAVVLSPDRPAPPQSIPFEWPLTPAERGVVSLLVRGQSNARIAEELRVTPKAVETHLAHAYEKLGVRRRAELVARYFQETQLPAIKHPNGRG